MEDVRRNTYFMTSVDYETIDLSGLPPETEPARQQYFIARCRQWVTEKSEELGRPMTCFISTFGCQMNARDSEKLEGILETIGYHIVETEDADFVVYNTCTVRENANLRVYGRLGQLGKYKKKNPGMIISLCGCMMQEPLVVEKLKKSYHFVNLIFGTHNIFKLAELVSLCLERRTQGGQKQGKTKMVVDVWKDTDQIVEDLPVERRFPFKSGVNIMFGCNNFCSYCIVPYVRGREKSREPQAIIREIEELVADGVTEIMLLGQNVNSYGKTLETPVTFAELLKEVEKIEGLKRIRFMTSHPKDLSDELIQTMAESQKICHHLHLPLQSGSSRVLKEMNRRYDKEKYLELVNKIRKAIPDISLTTDIMVGFPGETEEDLLKTMDYINSLPIEGVKLQLLHVLEHTDLAQLYRSGQYTPLTLEEYIDLLCACIARLRPDIVLHRLTGDGDKNILLAPLWSLNKRHVLNTIHKTLRQRNIRQGMDFGEK